MGSGCSRSENAQSLDKIIVQNTLSFLLNSEIYSSHMLKIAIAHFQWSKINDT